MDLKCLIQNSKQPWAFAVHAICSTIGDRNNVSTDKRLPWWFIGRNIAYQMYQFIYNESIVNYDQNIYLRSMFLP